MLWLVSAKTGKKAPVDAVPTFGGNVVVNRKAGTFTVVKPDRSPKFKLHFVTCPDQIEHRKKQPKRDQLPFALP